MNFFEAQARAKKHTFVYIVLFLLTMGGLIVLANLTIALALSMFESESYTQALGKLFDNTSPKTWLASSILIAGVVFVGSMYKIIQLSSGGESVAMALGGVKVNRNTRDIEKKRLLNVVEEMSIASGISVPPVYLLPEDSINAFAAGHTTDDVAIGVTQGLINTLTRDELQGVIAHEFSHIFNGDMKMNMRLTGGLHGILLIGLIGEGILRSFGRSRHTHRSSGSKDKNGSGVMIIMMVGLSFYLIGFLGKFMGGWIKAIISRQREYLADATAVQYTRYPEGISGALKKIGGLSYGSNLESDAATTHSHLFFAKGVNGFFSTMFSTHPPLQERILAIDPRWNGVYPKVTKLDHTKRQRHYKEKREDHQKEKIIPAVLAQSAIDSIATPNNRHLSFATKIDEKLSNIYGDSIGDGLGAQGIIFSLLAHDDPELLQRQKAMLSIGLVKEIDSALKKRKELKREQYLELVRLLIPTLKTLSLTQYKSFKSNMAHFIEIDRKVSMFEWCLQHILLRPLDKKFKTSKPIKMVYSNMDVIKNEVELVLSMLSQAQFKDDAQAEAALNKIVQKEGLKGFSYVQKSKINFKTFTEAVLTLEKAKYNVKEGLLKTILKMMMVDEQLSNSENELIQTMAEILQIPLPPLSA